MCTWPSVNDINDKTLSHNLVRLVSSSSSALLMLTHHQDPSLSLALAKQRKWMWRKASLGRLPKQAHGTRKYQQVLDNREGGTSLPLFLHIFFFLGLEFPQLCFGEDWVVQIAIWNQKGFPLTNICSYWGQGCYNKERIWLLQITVSVLVLEDARLSCT